LDKTRRKKLEDRLDSLDNNERQKLHKRATRLLKGMQKTERSDRGFRPRGADGWDEDGGPTKRRMRSTSSSVHDLMLQILDEEEPAFGEPWGEDEGLGTREGLVTAVYPRSCQVALDGELADCGLSPGIVALQQTELAVGDRVLVAERGGAVRTVTEVLPRRTRLSRPDPANPHLERVIVANVDAVVVVVSVRSPPLRPRLVDRYLVAIGRGGAEPVLCVNKLDLLAEEEHKEELDRLRPYEDLGVPVLPCSAATGAGLDELRRALDGKLCAFVGHSGVGKSSLLNALWPELSLRTAETSQSHGKGRHTTTASQLHELPGGIRVIDTPGIRSFGMWKMEAGELHRHFPEFEEPSSRCRFGDCTHAHEPGCGVQEALEAGQLSPVRFETYLRMLASLED
jgi:ribosome biogenesis GTPase / thiamine phosphate phosphatase